MMTEKIKPGENVGSVSGEKRDKTNPYFSDEGKDGKGFSNGARISNKSKPGRLTLGGIFEEKGAGKKAVAESSPGSSQQAQPKSQPKKESAVRKNTIEKDGRGSYTLEDRKEYIRKTIEARIKKAEDFAREGDEKRFNKTGVIPEGYIAVKGFSLEEKRELEEYILKENERLMAAKRIAEKTLKKSVERKKRMEKRELSRRVVQERENALARGVEMPGEMEIRSIFNLIFEDNSIVGLLSGEDQDLIVKARRYGIIRDLEDAFKEDLARGELGEVDKENFTVAIKNFCTNKDSFQKIGTAATDKDEIFGAIVRNIKNFDPDPLGDEEAKDEIGIVSQEIPQISESIKDVSVTESAEVTTLADALGDIEREKEVVVQEDIPQMFEQVMQVEAVQSREEKSPFEELEDLERKSLHLENAIGFLTQGDQELLGHLKKEKASLDAKIVSLRENLGIEKRGSTVEEEGVVEKNEKVSKRSARPKIKAAREPKREKPPVAKGESASLEKRIPIWEKTEKKAPASRANEIAERMAEIMAQVGDARKEYVREESNKKAALGEIYNFFRLSNKVGAENNSDVDYYRGVYEKLLDQARSLMVSDLQERGFSEKDVQAELRLFNLREENINLWMERSALKSEKIGVNLVEHFKDKIFPKEARALFSKFAVAGVFCMVLTGDNEFGERKIKKEIRAEDTSKISQVMPQVAPSEKVEREDGSVAVPEKVLTREETKEESLEKFMVKEWKTLEGALEEYCRAHRSELEKYNPEFVEMEDRQIAHLKALEFTDKGPWKLLRPGAELVIDKISMKVKRIEKDERKARSYLTESESAVVDGHKDLKNEESDLTLEKSFYKKDAGFLFGPEKIISGKELSPEAKVRKMKETMDIRRSENDKGFFEDLKKVTSNNRISIFGGNIDLFSEMSGWEVYGNENLITKSLDPNGAKVFKDYLVTCPPAYGEKLEKWTARIAFESIESVE